MAEYMIKDSLLFHTSAHFSMKFRYLGHFKNLKFLFYQSVNGGHLGWKFIQFQQSLF
jgi:hypothetical protein